MASIDINGYHVKSAHVVAAIEGAASGPLAEGSVGGGTGMTCYWFKCGTGTASRLARVGAVEYTVAVLVQANFGGREDLLVAGVPVGQEITDLELVEMPPQDGSIIVIIGTDAPLSSSQLSLVAKRATLGMARTGTIGETGSGDLFLAFSTARSEYDDATQLITSRALAKPALDPIFRATVEATEEAIINALVAGRDMEGINGNKAFGIPHQRLRDVLAKYRRLADD